MQNAFERGDGNDEALLDKLPRSLRGNVLRQINSRVLRRTPLFFRCDRALVGALAAAVVVAVVFAIVFGAREHHRARLKEHHLAHYLALADERLSGREGLAAEHGGA